MRPAGKPGKGPPAVTTNNPVASLFSFEPESPAPSTDIEPTATATRIWSPQQQDVFSFVRTGRGSAFVEAVAGSGKTTTLVEACRLMRGSVAFAAYNRAVSVEIKAKLEAEKMTHVRAGTFHSFGFSALARSVSGKIVVDEQAKRKAVAIQANIPQDIESTVFTLVSLAKQAGAGFLWQANDASHWLRLIDHHDLVSRLPNPDAPGAVNSLVGFAMTALATGNTFSEGNSPTIDYDDMIYLPLVRNLRIWQNDWVLVDEAQDTNPARRALARRMLKPSGRALFVGDPAQAIYGFTGADSDAISKIRAEFGCKSLPLTVTYRCPKSVVDVARQWVSHITAHESAPEGIARAVDGASFIKTEVPNLTAADAILCRNTKPLVALAFSLIRRGIPCHVEGRDIGAGLIALANRWKVTSVRALRTNLEAYKEREVARAIAKGREYAAESINDRVDTLLILMEGCDTVECVKSKINRMFADTPEGRPAPTLTLSTIHKSKGREWSRVYLLGFYTYCPSPFARQEWQQEQERNLQYVAATRAKAELVITSALD